MRLAPMYAIYQRIRWCAISRFGPSRRRLGRLSSHQTNPRGKDGDLHPTRDLVPIRLALRHKVMALAQGDGMFCADEVHEQGGSWSRASSIHRPPRTGSPWGLMASATHHARQVSPCEAFVIMCMERVRPCRSDTRQIVCESPFQSVNPTELHFTSPSDR